MQGRYEEVQNAAVTIKERLGPCKPTIGLVLGSGLGAFADALDEAIAIPYAELDGFAASTVTGHAGRFVAGTSEGVSVLAMQGRVHLYEGLPIAQVVLPVRAMVAAGCSKLIITNAAGGIRQDLDPGELVRITDHINFQGQNPLVGANDERFGLRFPDMSDAYDSALGSLAELAASEMGIDLKRGIYAGLLGPSYETPAEIQMLGRLGADLAGMSTVAEVIAAHHLGARVVGISCVTNRAAGLGGKLTHDEVKEVADRTKPVFIALLKAIISRVASA